MTAIILSAVLPTLESLAFAGSVWALAHLGAFLASRSSGSKVFTVLAQVEDLVAAIVTNAENVVKPALANGGTLTAAQGAELKAQVLASIKTTLGAKGLDTLKAVLGTVLGGDLDAWLSGKIEQAVTKLSSPKKA